MSNPPKDIRLSALLCFNVYALDRAFGRFYQASFGETGFTYPKFVALQGLSEAGPMSLGELSAYVGVEANSLSPLIKKMSGFGLIDRVRDPKDDRRVVLSLLPFGETVLAEAYRAIHNGFDSISVDLASIETVNAVLAETRRRLENAHVVKMSVPDQADNNT